MPATLPIHHQLAYSFNNKLSYRRGTARRAVSGETAKCHRCKNVFTSFILITFITFVNVFYLPNVFFIFLKNVGKVQSGKQINKKHFQNNSSEIDL